MVSPLTHAQRPDTARGTPEIEDATFFSIEGVAHSLNKPNAIMTTKGGSKAAHKGKCEPAIPDNPAPTTNPDHTLASIRARTRWESFGPCPSSRGSRPAAAARWPPILFSVPVTNVRLTDSAPTLDNAGFIIPMARLSIAISPGTFQTPCRPRPATVAISPATTPKIRRWE